jgi:hypothetical protein
LDGSPGVKDFTIMPLFGLKNLSYGKQFNAELFPVVSIVCFYFVHLRGSVLTVVSEQITQD